MRKMLRGKIHRATVTGADLHYEGSVTIDRELMDQAGFIDNEAVHIWDVNNGERFETYVIPGERHSGVVCINGAAAHKVSVDDLVIIAPFRIHRLAHRIWMAQKKINRAAFNSPSELRVINKIPVLQSTIHKWPASLHGH